MKSIIKLGIIVLFFYLFRNFLCPQFFHVASGSMEPTLMTGNYIMVPRLQDGIVERRDVAVFPFEGDMLVKRVIGLPGDTIVLTGGELYVNGELQVEEYVKEEMNEEEMTFQVPEGQAFLMGDNRNNSFDSRYWDYPFINLVDILIYDEEKGIKF